MSTAFRKPVNVVSRIIAVAARVGNEAEGMRLTPMPGLDAFRFWSWHPFSSDAVPATFCTAKVVLVMEVALTRTSPFIRLTPHRHPLMLLPDRSRVAPFT
jgi:hypothetical protein